MIKMKNTIDIVQRVPTSASQVSKLVSGPTPWFEYHLEKTGRRRNVDDPRCRIRKDAESGKTYLPFSWDNLRGYGTSEQQRAFSRYRKVVARLLMERMRSRGLEVFEVGTPISKTTAASDIDLNVCWKDPGKPIANLRDISAAALGSSTARSARKMLERLADLFDMNLYPYVKNPVDSSKSRETHAAYGDSRHRIIEIANEQGLADVFKRAHLEALITRGLSSCDNDPDLSKIGTTNHCQYAKQLPEVYMGYGAYMHIVMGVRDAPNRNWYLLSMLDNLGFLMENLFGEQHRCYKAPPSPRLVKVCKYLMRMADAVILYDPKDRHGLKVPDLLRKATAARKRGAANERLIWAVYRQLGADAAGHSKQSDMYVPSTWLVLILEYFRPYIKRIVSLH